MRKRNRILLILVFPISAIAISVVFYLYSYKIHAFFDTKRFDAALTLLAQKSLISKDVPVGAILLFNDSIIGEGYNTVLKDKNAGGHAEINAISNCLQSMSMKEFRSLNRNTLVLISTYEPCQMCRGALENYNINHIVFALPKNPAQKLKMLKNDLGYYFNLYENGNGRLQYELFKQHPDFDTLHTSFVN